MRLTSLPLVLAFGASLGELPYIRKELDKSFEDHAFHRRWDVDRLKISPAKVELAGPTDIPLVTLDPADRTPYVEVLTADPKTGEEHTWVFAVDPGAAGVQVTDDFAKAHGEEPVKVLLNHATPTTVVRLPGLTVGGLRLLDITAEAGLKGSRGDWSIDGVLGLGAFPELAGAVLASQGLLRLAPAAQGAALLDAVGGQRLPYRSIAAQAHKDGSRKWVHGAYPLVVDLQFQGRPARAALLLQGDTGRPGDTTGVVARGFAQGEPLVQAGGSALYSGPLALGSVAVDALLREVPGESYDRVPLDLALDLGRLGASDLAWSPATGTLALALAAGGSPLAERPALDWRVLDRLIAEAARGLEPNPETGEAPDAEAVASTQLTLAGLYALRPGDTAQVLDALDAAVAATPEDCAVHLSRGEWLLGQDRHADALPSLFQAGLLYGEWTSLSREERAQVKEDKARAEDKGEEYAGPRPQPNACYTVWGLEAEAHLAAGNHAGVEALYRARLDLDTHLPLVAATSYLLQGRLVDAEAALRQASTRAGPNDAAVGSGLALVYARQGRGEQALALQARVVLASRGALHASKLYARLATLTLGPEAALARLEAESARAPALLGPRLAAIELALAQGQARDAELAAVRAQLERLLAAPSGDADVLSAYAWALQLGGQADAARTAAQRALLADPMHVVALTLLAELGEPGARDRAMRAAIGLPGSMALLAEGDGV